MSALTRFAEPAPVHLVTWDHELGRAVLTGSFATWAEAEDAGVAWSVANHSQAWGVTRTLLPTTRPVVPMPAPLPYHLTAASHRDRAEADQALIRGYIPPDHVSPPSPLEAARAHLAFCQRPVASAERAIKDARFALAVADDADVLLIARQRQVIERNEAILATARPKITAAQNVVIALVAELRNADRAARPGDLKQGRVA